MKSAIGIGSLLQVLPPPCACSCRDSPPAAQAHSKARLRRRRPARHSGPFHSMPLLPGAGTLAASVVGRGLTDWAGGLAQDGLGDTIRVSLTEDPWLELDPARKLRAIADEARSAAAAAAAAKVPTWRETTRDFTVFGSRDGALPVQRAGDAVDVRGFLHRDGSVLAPVSLEQVPPTADACARRRGGQEWGGGRVEGWARRILGCWPHM